MDTLVIKTVECGVLKPHTHCVKGLLHSSKSLFSALIPKRFEGRFSFEETCEGENFQRFSLIAHWYCLKK
jgi:hypothetical protein